MKNITDIEIIESILRGNKNDFSLLINRYKDRSFSFINRILKNKSDSEEVLQDVFVKVYFSLNKFKGESKFSTWLYRIAFNAAVTKARIKNRIIEMEMESIDNVENKLTHSDVFSFSESQSEFIYRMIDKLPIRNSLVLILFYVDELSVSEISEVMNISIVNVKVMLYRSRNLLRDLLIKFKYMRVENE